MRLRSVSLARLAGILVLLLVWLVPVGAEAPDSTDTEFVRRLYLDMTGRSPTAAEVKAFLDDAAADKRVRLIEKLTHQPGLENLLDQALKANPDVRLAESKLREAEADLNRTRLQVMQKVVSLHQAMETQRSAVKDSEAKLARARALHKNGALTAEELDAAVQADIREKAKLASLEVEVPYLIGRPPTVKAVAFSPDGKLLVSETANVIRFWDAATGKVVRELAVPAGGITGVTFAPDGLTLKVRHTTGEVRVWEVATGKEVAAVGKLIPLELRPISGESGAIAPALAEKIRKALDRPVKVDYSTKNANDVLDDLLSKIEGVPARVRIKVGPMDEVLPFKFKEALPLGAALQAFQDETLGNKMVIVVRDYGILVTTSAQMPENAVRLHDLWKMTPPSRPAPE